MFLRWQMRKSVASRHRESPPVRPVALLVESVRIDGKPRQRHVAYLFSIWHGEEDKLGDRHWQVRWWVEASDRLDELGDRVKPARSVGTWVSIQRGPWNVQPQPKAL